ncbi:MAG: hypothetical protein Q8936_13445 [Bacillota bacterium]|nr:hypothetical protein [Bacillota bacterium]
MCMMLYTASDVKLPLVPAGQQDYQPIYVDELSEYNLDVKKQFTKKYVYYIGSYQGCGCGFSYGQYDIEDKEVNESFIEIFNAEQEKRKRSVRELFNYITNNLKNVSEIELYSCWAGNEKNTSKHKLHISLANLSLPNKFSFEEDQLIIVHK